MSSGLIVTAFGASALALGVFVVACSMLVGLDPARTAVVFGLLLVVHSAGFLRRASRLQG
jgi:hypothetical protein